jgi:hypothetical protein
MVSGKPGPIQIDDREEVDEHERRGRDTELAVKRKFLVERYEWFCRGHGGAPVYREIEAGVIDAACTQVSIDC